MPMCYQVIMWNNCLIAHQLFHNWRLDKLALTVRTIGDKLDDVASTDVSKLQYYDEYIHLIHIYMICHLHWTLILRLSLFYFSL